MPYLFEILENKKILDKKIKELSSVMSVYQNEVLAEKLFTLIDERLSMLMDIETANNVSTINIGGNEVTIATAISIRDAVKGKIDILTSLIEDKNCELDKIKLQEQRDKYISEHVLLSMGINRNDLQVKVG